MRTRTSPWILAKVWGEEDGTEGELHGMKVEVDEEPLGGTYRVDARRRRISR